MKYRASIYTLALLGALALAAVSGGLLTTSDNVVYAADPVFDTDSNPGTRSIPENTPPGVNIGDPISATDPDEDGLGNNDLEFGNTLTYSLEATADTDVARADAASFDIDPSTGQLITKAALDTETKLSYLVTVRVDDGETPVTQNVFITVKNVAELPEAPYPPTVVSGEDTETSDEMEESTTSLKVVWHPPENMGGTINDYDVEYKKSTEPSFGDTLQTSGTTTTKFTGLDADTSYDVRVRARNSNEGPWSFVGTGSTNKEGNSPPQSTEDSTPTTRRVDENTPAGENVGSPVTATDGDTTTLTYRMDGPDADLFNFNIRTGQIRTKAPLNHEDPRCYVESNADDTDCTYYVTVTVVDGAGGSDATGVKIEVDDRVEPASAPARPTVRATEKSSTSLEVSWNTPANPGPAIVSYEVQYRKGTETFSSDGVDYKGTTATISGTDDNDPPWLAPNTTYEVRVRAKNGERDSAWSGTGTGRTNKANHEPIFDDRPGTGKGSARNSTDGFTIWRTIEENPRVGQTVGRVFADDEDNDTLTYKLVAEDFSKNQAQEDVSKFTINETTGEIRTKAGVTYNYEEIGSGTCAPLNPMDIGSDSCYTVEVEVRDGLDSDRVEVKETIPDDSITLKIGVRDRDEPPSVPTVMVTSPAGNTTLEVFWHAKNTGPEAITYDVQYRKGGGAFSDENCTPAGPVTACNGITGTTTTITELDEDTSYSVQVRAKNEEGTSAWSPVVTVKTNKGENVPPTFTDGASPVELMTVPENTPAGRDVGNPVNATDLITNSPTYELGGRDAGLFTIVRTSGQIRTSASLNHEETPDCEPDNGSINNCYKVLVKVDDEAGGSASKEVTITVSDVEEPPSAPSAPRVTATKETGWSLDVTWNEPRDTGNPPITDYDIQYRKFKSGTPKDEWQPWPHGTDNAGNTSTSTEIDKRDPDNDDPLEPSTQYEVRVRAKNGEADTTENWSSVGKGTTGASNSRPSFDRTEAVVTLRVDENTRAGQTLGSAVSASDADSNSLTYTLEGPGADSFTIVSSSGQIRTKSPLDYETRQSYSVTVKVDDRQNRDNSIAAKSVTITVDNVREKPPAPAAPTVAGIPGSTDSVRVTWDEPANTGPPVKEYDVHYREVGSGWGRWDHYSADRSTIITGLKAGTRYEAQVRARSDEGTGEWSRAGSGAPNPDVANRNPAFSGGSRTLSVAENTPPNTDVGAPVAATDRDGDTLTYTLEGADADSFDILSTSDGGQIRTSAELNHEEKSSYSVTVRVTDGRGGSDAVNLTIRVTDVDGEAPAIPFAPTVTAVSSTRLQVSWEAPDNQGPPITDYDYRYREPAGSWTEVTNTTITGTTVTIQGLAASTSYDVEVSATNAEGTSDWSNPGIGATNAPGANNPPVFPDGTSATRSVSATASAGTSIGLPVAATDADSGDTLTFSLEGRDAASFDINTSSGQLLTRSGVTLIAGETYTVTVAADDGTDISRITVAIEATVAPPNNPPVFTEGSSATRSVSRSAPAGTHVGQPVTATDSDPVTTLTYSLEGADAASFGINAANGQLLTVAGVTLDRNSYTVTVVASDGIARASITVAIEVTATLPNNPPTFSSTTATRSVDENTPAGQNVGISVSATDADSDDTLNYTLGGTNASSFDIVSDTGQLRTKAALDYETKFRYTVTITVSDSELTDSISVTINVTDMHPGCPSAVGNGSNTGLVNDCEALLDSRSQLEGTTNSLNWSAGRAILQWEGITLRGTPARVAWLNIRDGGLNGSVPTALGRLSNLTYLNLRSNDLTGPIPAELGDLSNLGVLNLHSNELTGVIPSELGGLSNLREMWLHANRLSGPIPASLGNLSNLEKLKLRNNDLSGPIPASLGSLDKLEWFVVHNNRLSGSIPDSLGNMTSLEILWLGGNLLDGDIPTSLGKLSNLTQLHLRTNGLTGRIPTDLKDLTNLRRMWLHSNELTGAIPSDLGDLANLEILNLRDNMLSESIPTELSSLTKLKDLFLHQNMLTGSIPTELGSLPNLTRLWLSENRLTGSIPSSLGSFSMLTQLNLHTNRLTGAIPSDLGDLGDTLTRLRLGGNTGLTGCVPAALAAATHDDDLAAAGANGLGICQ